MILDITYLGGWYPSGLLRDRQAKVNALQELQSPALRFGDAPQSASRAPKGVLTL
jgi:hypothetical protein